MNLNHHHSGGNFSFSMTVTGIENTDISNYNEDLEAWRSVFSM